MNKIPAALLAAALVFSAACSKDERAWRRARAVDSARSYAAYERDNPNGSHLAEAFQRASFLIQKEQVDAIFLGLAEKYDFDGIPYTLRKATAPRPAHQASGPSEAMTSDMVSPPVPPPPPPGSRGANSPPFIDVGEEPGLERGIILTVEADGSCRIHKTSISPERLFATVREIFEPRMDKTIYLRFFNPVKGYADIVRFVVLLKKAGVENCVPLITPQVRDVVWNEFKGGLDLPILEEDVYAGTDGFDPFGPAQEEGTDYGLEGGIAGGVEGGVVGGVVGGIPTDLAEDDDAPVRVGGQIPMPKLIKDVSPVYPELARTARVEGVVILEVTTDARGRVVDCRILRSIPLLDQAAVEAVRQRVYEPVVVGSKPRSVIFTATVNFRLY